DVYKSQHLGGVGNNIVKQSPEFDPRNYGYAKMSALVIATKLFDAEERAVSTTGSKAVYVRDKRHKP
ncbi:MAG: OST-HTH/LOTUS domain-containing protein, partial [Lysobacterales bacterium]